MGASAAASKHDFTAASMDTFFNVSIVRAGARRCVRVAAKRALGWFASSSVLLAVDRAS